MADRPAHDSAEHVSAPFVRRKHPVGEKKCDSTPVITLLEGNTLLVDTTNFNDGGGFYGGGRGFSVSYWQGAADRTDSMFSGWGTALDDQVVAEHAATALQYGATEGYLPLREAIADVHGLELSRIVCGNGSDEDLDVVRLGDRSDDGVVAAAS